MFGDPVHRAPTWAKIAVGLGLFAVTVLGVAPGYWAVVVTAILGFVAAGVELEFSGAPGPDGKEARRS